MSTEQRLAYNRRWKEAHPGYMQQWRRLNPDKEQAYNEKRRKRYLDGKRREQPVSVPLTIPCPDCARIVLLTDCEHCKAVICGKCYLEHVKRHTGHVEGYRYWGNQWEEVGK